MAYRITGTYGRQTQTDYHNSKHPPFQPDPTSLQPVPGQNYSPIPAHHKASQPPIHSRQVSECFDPSAQQLFDYMTKVSQLQKGSQRNEELRTVVYAVNRLKNEKNPSVTTLLRHMHETGLIPFPPERLGIIGSESPGPLEGSIRTKILDRTQFQKGGRQNFSLEEVKSAIEWLSEIQDRDVFYLLDSAREIYDFRIRLEPGDKTYEARILQNMPDNLVSQPPAPKPQSFDRDHTTPRTQQHIRTKTNKQQPSPRASAKTEHQYSELSLRGCGDPTITDFDPKAPVATLVAQLIEKGHPLYSHHIVFAGKAISEGDDLLVNMDTDGYSPRSINCIHLIPSKDFQEPLEIYLECFTWKDGNNQRYALMDERYNKPDKIEAALVTLYRQSRGLPVETPIDDTEFHRLRKMLVTAKEHVGESTTLKNHKEKAETYFQTLLTSMDLHRFPGRPPVGKNKPRAPVPDYQPLPRRTAYTGSNQPVQRTTYTAPRIPPPVPKDFEQPVMASLQFNTGALSANQKEAYLPLQQRINTKQKERMEQFKHSVEKPNGEITVKTLTGKSYTIPVTHHGPVAEIIMGLLQKKACHLYSARIIHMGDRIGFGDILKKRQGTGNTDFAKEGPIHLVHTDGADNIRHKFCEFFGSQVKDPETGAVEPMMPEGMDTPEDIENLLVRIFDQMRGGQATVYAHEFIELQSHLKEAKKYAEIAKMSDEDKSRLKDFIDTLLRCLSIYKLPFVGRQKAFLDEHIKEFQSYRSEEHQKMTAQELLNTLDKATMQKDTVEAYRCLDVLIQGMKFNLLTVEQLAQVMANPYLPQDVKEALRPLVTLHASQTAGLHSLRTHTARHLSRTAAPPTPLPLSGQSYSQTRSR